MAAFTFTHPGAAVKHAKAHPEDIVTLEAPTEGRAEFWRATYPDFIHTVAEASWVNPRAARPPLQEVRTEQDMLALFGPTSY
jgi:hypothetical protein